MCRLVAITSEAPLSPMIAMEALEVMKEGHDGSGVGLFMTGLGEELEDLRETPILSGIFTSEGLRRLDEFMMNLGFLTKYKFSIRTQVKMQPVDITLMGKREGRQKSLIFRP